MINSYRFPVKEIVIVAFVLSGYVIVVFTVVNHHLTSLMIVVLGS